MISFRIQSVLNFLVFTLVFIIIFPFSSCKKEEERIMKVRNDSISNVSNTSAKAHATVIDIGSGIDQQGHCWSTSAELTIDINDGKSELGSLNITGSFTSVMNGLSPDTKYYVRAYVRKSSTVVYGNDILSFRTLTISTPVVTTGTVKNITESGATLTGDLKSFGSGVSSVSQHGHCWSDETTTPTIDDYKTSLGLKDKTGSFESVIVGLSPGVLYYARAYATNNAGTVYGDTVSFKTLRGEGIPSVTTGTINNITETSASATGNLDDLGSGFSSVSQHGHCWSSEATSPTINNNRTSLGSKSSTGNFESSLTGLTPNVLYYVRAYATNNAGTGYGNPVSFSTVATAGDVPEVRTASVGPITGTTATSGGSITSDGGSSITAKGVCWSKNRFPAISDYKTNEGGGTGSFVSVMTGLDQKTLYYVRAYATNASGTGYGDEIAFVTDFDCGTMLTDPRDGKTYLTIQIGSQCWMAENLNVGQRIDGAQSQANNSVIEKYCYNNNEDNCDMYGGLYQWDEMMQYTTTEMTQGVCPKGWHIPSENEWQELEISLGMDPADAASTGMRGTNEGTKLKEGGSSGFEALMSGKRNVEAIFENLGVYTTFWNSTGTNRTLSTTFPTIYNGGSSDSKSNGFSLRCVED